jgi:hypothetical protein
VETVAFLRGTNAVMTQTYSRDNLGRLSGASTALAGGETLNGVSYQLDSLDRRFEADLADGTKWDYGYNNRSEVVSGKKQLASGAFEGGNNSNMALTTSATGRRRGLVEIRVARSSGLRTIRPTP